MKITLTKFTLSDIPNKIKWINDSNNNQYLHYDLPLEYEKTVKWYNKNRTRNDRFDAVIKVDDKSVGLAGLLSIDDRNRKAEFYIVLGDSSYKGKGVATQATLLLLEKGFKDFHLNKIYCFTEQNNLSAQKLFQRVSFSNEGLLQNDLFFNNKFVNRYVYGITKYHFLNKRVNVKKNKQNPTEIDYCQTDLQSNQIYIKRDDLLPFCFGGNKARKAQFFKEEILKGDYNCLVTYGSSSSNHARVISNLASSLNMKSYIVSPIETKTNTFNRKLFNIFNAEVVFSPLSEISSTIDLLLNNLKKKGEKPYFIQGGGHGVLGTQAYVNCYREIVDYETNTNNFFDYIFLASGTGSTQAGLICGHLINNDMTKIVGISIARKNPYGKKIIVDSVKRYLELNSLDVKNLEESVIFIDEYICGGYGKINFEITDIVNNMLTKYGIPFNCIYTGKAFYGMKEYIKKENIENSNILFLHTGGVPLFFDDLEKLNK